ncbi:MAG: lamin tail domain-containing protein [Verrucomicrobiales bacterium]
MKRVPILLCVLPAILSLARGVVLINETDSDNPATDNLEFVELYNPDALAVSLTGLTVVFFNGNGDVAYLSQDLDGFTIPANGYFVLGNAAVLNADVTFPDNTLQNGPDAVALYTANATDFPVGTAVTTTGLIDAVVYDTSDADDAGLLVLLQPGQLQVDENATASSTTVSIGRLGDGAGGARVTSSYSVMTPTPGFANIPEPSTALIMLLALVPRRRSRSAAA